MIDSISEIECKMFSLDTYQLRSPTHIITVNKEGFEYFKDSNQEKWNHWLMVNNIKSVKRTDV